MKLSELKEAIEIFTKYQPDEHFIGAEHDEIWVSDVAPDVLTEDERKRLDEIGFRWNRGVGSWARFV